MAEQAPRRRTQQERSSAMRDRLLQATIDCLVDHGYAGTTVTRIAERAGVTRGAQVHHFRTKADLVTAAILHLAQRRVELGWAEIEQVLASDDPVGRTLDLLWETHQGPIFIATVEMWVAARTDDTLREHLAQLEPAVTSSLERIAEVAVGDVSPELVGAIYTAMDAMRGLTISAWHLPAAQRDARWRRLKERLRRDFPSREDFARLIAGPPG